MSGPDRPSAQPPCGRVVDLGLPSVTVYPPGATHGPRSLQDHELVWVIEGGGRVIFEASELHIRSGSLLLLGPGPVHAFEWDADRPSIHGYVHFTLGPAAATPMLLPAHRSSIPDDPLAALCRYLVWLAANRAAGWAQQTRDVLECLLGIMLDGPLPVPPRPTWPVIDAVLRHASDAWAAGPMRALSLREMAAAASISQGHLNRSFRTHLGASPAATIERIRLARAERLLVRSDVPLGRIAEATGFADRYHLSRRFSRCFGTPPATWRRLARRGDVPLPPAIVDVLPLVDRLSGTASTSRVLDTTL